MSRQENAPNRLQGLAATTTPSRITRTNPNSNQRLLNNPSPANDPSPAEEEPSKLTLLPNRVSALDKNVLYQDMDRGKPSAYQSTNSSRTNYGSTSSSILEGEKAMGLISNVFLGSTNKFVKGTLNNATTPVKVEEPEQQPQDTKGTPAKFSRNKDIEQKARTISMREPPQETGQATDRSGAETGKKIERRQAGNREMRELKFALDKKEEKIESTPEKVGPAVVLSARKTETFKAQAVKTETVTAEEVVPEQSFQRVYQPIQRQTTYPRSRLVTEQPPSVEIETLVQKPKEDPPKPMNRLVQSRLQSQLAQSKVSAQKQVKPIPNVSRTSESRLITEVSPPEAVQAKQEIKPKPYSRSFISKKPQQTEQINAQSTIIQPGVKQPPQQQIKPTLQQSKLSETKSKSQVKESAPEASDIKFVLKKTGCIALIGKRIVRSRLIQGFALLKSHKQADKVKKVNECQILCCSMSSITKVKQSNLIKLAFQNIRRRFATAYITSLKSFADEAPSNYKNTAAQLLDRLYCSKLRQSFNVFKVSMERFRNKAKCVVVFESFFKQKVKSHMRRSFESIKLRQKNLINLLNQLSTIYTHANKAKLVIAFSRIASVKPVLAKTEVSPVKQPQKSKVTSKIEQLPAVINNTSNQALIDKLDKLKKAFTTSQSEISSLEGSLAKKKKALEGEEGSLAEKVTLLKHQNEQVNNQIEIKKHRSGQIKKQMETIPKKNRQLEQELTEPRQNKLEFLTNIYISNFKNAEESVSTTDLLNSYGLKAEDSSLLFNEWASILRNVELKRLIAAYEGVDPRENKGRANLVSQQALISRLIRSYVKEQYFWEWIHLSAQNS